MRYAKDHKKATHRKLVEIAASRFRKDGLSNVGVASLMNDAGLTHGGFYSHFPSKEALIKEALDTGMDASFDRLMKNPKSAKIDDFIRNYLRIEHRDHPEAGCPAAALAPEIARHSLSARKAFTRKLQMTLSHIESLLPVPDPAIAQAVFSILVGAMQLARAVPDPVLSKQLLDAAINSASSIAHSRPCKT